MFVFNLSLYLKDNNTTPSCSVFCGCKPLTSELLSFLYFTEYKFCGHKVCNTELLLLGIQVATLSKTKNYGILVSDYEIKLHTWLL